MKQLLVVMLSLAVGLSSDARPAAAGGPRAFEGGLDPELWLVESTSEHRLVVFRRCSPEHCFTESYLQWLETRWPGDNERESPTSVEVATVPLEEANGVGAFVKKATWRTKRGTSVLYLELLNSYSDEASTQVRVEPMEKGRYRVVR